MWWICENGYIKFAARNSAKVIIVYFMLPNPAIFGRFFWKNPLIWIDLNLPTCSPRWGCALVLGFI